MQTTEMDSGSEHDPVLDIESLDVQYATEKGAVRAVRDVSLSLEQG